MTLKAVRTPEDRFANLADWPYRTQYLSDLPGREGLRLAYYEAGPKDAEVTFLCLHGEPSWSYLYRKMAPVFVAAGARFLAFDWFGFGQSDKPVEDAAYTFAFHRDTGLAVLDALAPRNVCLVVQDWGGLLGLTLPMARPEMITRLLIMNTTIGLGRDAGPGFQAWRDYVANTPDLDVGALMARATPGMTEAEQAAYAAPFPDALYKAGVRRFPQLVQTDPSMEGVDVGRAALEFFANDWRGESFLAIGMQDPVLGPPAMTWLASVIPGCPAPMEVAEAGHFVQEWGAPIARAALAHFRLG